MKRLEKRDRSVLKRQSNGIAPQRKLPYVIDARAVRTKGIQFIVQLPFRRTRWKRCPRRGHNQAHGENRKQTHAHAPHFSNWNMVQQADVRPPDGLC